MPNLLNDLKYSYPEQKASNIFALQVPKIDRNMRQLLNEKKYIQDGIEIGIFTQKFGY